MLTLKKLYADDLRKECFIDKTVLSNYKNDDYHSMYVCEITGMYKAEV